MRRLGGRRHGSNPGTVGLAGQRVPIRVPRIRHVAGSEIPLRSYEALHGDRAVNDVLLKRVLYGISCRNYEAAAEAIPGAIGLSGSTGSRGFIQASAAKLRELQERDLSGEDVGAVVLDGKTFAEATMVIALGITIAGGKRFLGFVETDTENARVLTPFLRSLVERGLDLSQGVLVILDGSKGLRAAVRKAFRNRALVHRCQWHKRENVVSSLAKREQASWRQRLQRAYTRPEYDEARAALETLHRELEDRNQSAAGSLKEGLDETLTLHRLGHPRPPTIGADFNTQFRYGGRGNDTMSHSESLADVLREIAATLRIERPLAVLDVETTGIWRGYDRVVQVAFATVTLGREVTTRSRLINPEIPIPVEATEVHGITNADVADAPTFPQVARSLAESLAGHDFIGYQVRFDREMLESEFARADVPSPFVGAAQIDPLRIWQHLETRKLSDAVERFYGKRPDEEHRADADVNSTARALVGQLREHGGDRLPLSVQALHEISHPREPTWIDAEGKIVWRDGAARFSFGERMIGVALHEADHGLLEWLLRGNFPADVKRIVRDALAGTYPAAPA